MMWERDPFWMMPDRVIISVTLFELYAIELLLWLQQQQLSGTSVQYPVEIMH